MCGIQPGEKVVFTPEQMEVTVADGTHIEFCGKLFTLSGFCRAFMPEGRRKPSNAYQGPKYFTYNGVTPQSSGRRKPYAGRQGRKARRQNPPATERTPYSRHNWHRNAWERESLPFTTTGKTAA